MATYCLGNFVNEPSQNDRLMFIYNCSGVLVMSIDPYASTFFKKDKYVYIVTDGRFDYNNALDFDSESTADSAVAKLNNVKKTFIDRTNQTLNGCVNLVSRELFNSHTSSTDLHLTQDQHDALTGEGTPSTTNLYVTKSYVRMARKEILFPEFQSATFTAEPFGANIGTLRTDSEAYGDYIYNFYKWLSAEVTMQSYAISVQWRVPETWLNWNTSAMIVDICTEEDAVTNNKIDVIIRKDGTPVGFTWLANTAYVEGDVVFPLALNGFSYRCTTAGTSDPAVEPTWPIIVGSTVNDPIVGGEVTWICQRHSRIDYFSTVATNWYSEREGTQVITFTRADLGIVTAGDTLNITIRMYSKDSQYVKIGAITFQYTG
jgi:hypothetical protein